MLTRPLDLNQPDFSFNPYLEVIEEYQVIRILAIKDWRS